MVNEYFQLIHYGGSFYYYIFELANFCFLAFFVIIFYKLNYINSNSLLVWVGLFFTPLLFNYFLIIPEMYGDQFEYAGEIMSLKSTGESISTIGNTTGVASSAFSYAPHPITFTSLVLGTVPLPNYMTVTSLAFANKLFIFGTFLWFKNFFQDENKVLLCFLIPSLILYSSLSLRDTLIIILSLFFLLNLLRGKYVFAGLLLYPIFILKIQMFAIFSLYFIGRLLFRAHRSYLMIGIFAATMLVVSLVIEEDVLTVMNTYRLAFSAEDFDLGGGTFSYAGWAMYGSELGEALKVNSIPEAIYIAVLRLPEFLLMPMPWNWTNFFYPIQALESYLLIYLYYKLATRRQLYKNPEFALLTFMLLIGLLMYSLIMANEGTFVRYRFTLFYPFLLALFYLAYSKLEIKQS